MEIDRGSWSRVSLASLASSDSEFLTSLEPCDGRLCDCASYFTLLSLWLAFGNSGERAWAIPLAFACFVIQSTLLYLLGEANAEYIVAFAIAATIYSLALLLPMIALRRITLAHIERLSRLGGLYSERFNFGIGEIIFATAVIAILLALAKLVLADYGFLAILAVVPLCSLFNFVLAIPIVILTLSSRSEPVVIGLSLLSMAATFAGEIIVCGQSLDFEMSLPRQDLDMLVLLNATFVLTTFLHLAITRFLGYRLVRLQLN